MFGSFLDDGALNGNSSELELHSTSDSRSKE